MVVFKFDNAGILKSKVYATAKKLIPEIKRVNSVSNYSDERASVHLPFDDVALKAVKSCISQKRRLRPSLLVVVGIGGSNLGTIAVHEVINGKLYNFDADLKVLFADTTDPDLIAGISAAMKHELAQGRQVVLNAISKSGGTTETIANFEVLFNVLKRHRKDAEKYCVVTTGKDSKLWRLAVKRKMSVLEIPKLVGGRYSVFSPVGLFPLGMLGINLTELLDGAADMRKRCATENVKNNPAALGASLIYLHSKSKRNIYDHFLFATDLESVGKWYRQLLGESIGKKHNRKGKVVNNGVTPTVSIGSTDLHSMAQLYLGGPQDKFTNFVTTHFKRKVKTPSYKDFDKLVSNIQKTELAHIMRAIFEGVKIAYKKDKRPFTETRLEGKTEFEIGALLQLKMVETMMLGVLFNVNPFNQPSVEKYKVETKRLLSNKSSF